jgi:uncharacterized protein (TIGR02145 family)
MKYFLFLMIFCFGAGWLKICAQVAINSTGVAPDNSAILDVQSSNKGLLLPRLSTAEMNAIVSPAEGLMIFNTTVKSLCWFDGESWIIAHSNEGGSCGTVSYGGQNYSTVIIGWQCWMKENLRVGQMILGGMAQSNNGLIEKYCYFNDPVYCEVYGGLYLWDEMMQYSTTPGVQGICPPGWHIPTESDWNILTDLMGGLAVAGGKLKETGTSHWYSPNEGATNSSNFTALPSGDRATNGGFYDLCSDGMYWTSVQDDANNSWSRALTYTWYSVIRRTYTKTTGLPVRCVKN